MKTTKILLALMLALTLCMSFAACSDDEPEAAPQSTAQADDAGDEVYDDAGDEEDAGEAETVEEDAGEQEDAMEMDPNIDTSAFDHLADSLSACYMGGFTNDETTFLYVGFSADQSYGVIAFLSNTTGESTSFVGSLEQVSDTQLMITDDTRGQTLTFTVTEIEGGFEFGMGDVGTALVAPITADQLIYALAVINAGTQQTA